MVSLIVDAEYAVQECQRFLYAIDLILSNKDKETYSIQICPVNYKKDMLYPSLVEIVL